MSALRFHVRVGGVRGRRTGARPALARRTLCTVVDLTRRKATDLEIVGAKAANLAIARRRGLAVLPGFAITVETVDDALAAGSMRAVDAAVLGELRRAWSALSDDGAREVVVRSSSVTEDSAAGSMAGRFTSVLGVAGWSAFLDAVEEVARSAQIVSLVDGSVDRHPMGILVQPMLAAARGGVVFSVDPVTGRTDRRTVATVVGGPDQLVSGADGGVTQVVTCWGRSVSGAVPSGSGAGLLLRLSLMRMARQVTTTFGQPQDLEWAVDHDHRLWLLQSRPITAVAQRGEGPILGPGPLAETFPDPLSTLEQDLWVEPLRIGMIHALALSGTASPRRVATSPVVAVVDGQVAVDLDLLGMDGTTTTLWRKLDPRPGGRRLRASWRVGRLRRAFPTLAATLVASVDSDLSQLSRLSELSDERLCRVLTGSRHALVALHGQEVLAGLLIEGGVSAAADTATAAGEALRALTAGRAEGLDDQSIVSLRPVVLALVPPAVRRSTPLPSSVAGVSSMAPPAELGLREQLRLRTRWVHELVARAAWEAGGRLAARGLLAETAAVNQLDFDALVRALAGDPRVSMPPLARPLEGRQLPLPSRFRLSSSGRPVPVIDPAGNGTVGRPAGGGRGTGVVVHDPAVVTSGTVLVTRTLEPRLAVLLPRLSGLIAETGSPLSHLAILARELGVPVVVGVAQAIERFPVGTTVLVDGSTGDVAAVAGG